MKRIKCLVCKALVLLLLISNISGGGSIVLAKKSTYGNLQSGMNDNKEIIVRYKNDSISESTKSSVKNKLMLSKLVTKKKLKKNNLEVLEISEEESIDTVINELKNNTNVLYAQPNYRLSINTLPMDVNFNQQWGLLNVGQAVNGKSGKSSIDINIVKAWEITEGSSDVLVGVLDTGIDIYHSDLIKNIFTNLNEIPANGLDDDGNGFVDDVNGWDFINNDNTVFDSEAMDAHGTHVAGTIAASHNSEGIVGVAPGVKVLPLKFINGTNGYTSDAIVAIEYAEQMGVKIINCSWGGSEYNIALEEAMQNSDILYVCAAGNYSSNNALYPAGFDIPNILSVGAIDNTGVFAPYSNYGSNVHIAAPGSNVLSTLPGNGYGYLSGTSMAAPFVTGTAALIKSYLPDISSSDILNRINNNSIKYDELKYKVTSGGRIDAYSALLNVQTTGSSNTIVNVNTDDNIIINPDNKNLEEAFKLPKDNSAAGNGKIPKPLNSVGGIRNLKIELIKDSVLFVTWTTDKEMTSEFYYGKTESLSENKILQIRKNTHQILIKDFNVSDYKWYKVKSIAEDGSEYQTEISKIEDIIKIRTSRVGTEGKEKTVTDSVYNSVYSSVYYINSLSVQNLIATQGYIYEPESNNSYIYANVINDLSVYGYIHWFFFDYTGNYNYDVDWYKISLNDPNNLTVSLKEVPYDDIYEYTIYTSNMTPICSSGSMNGSIGTINIQNYGYGPGTYYVRISPNYCYEDYYYDGISYKNHNYLLEVGTVQDIYEPNNNIDTATPLSDNIALSTNIYTDWDEDWFSFYTNKAGKMTVTLWDIPENTDYDMEIYDENGDCINGSYNGGIDSEECKSIITPGQYYIRVYSYSGYDNRPYMVKATVVTADSYELNDGYYYASRLAFGNTIWATIDSWTDEDWFEIIIPEPTIVNIKLDNIPSGCDYDLYVFNPSTGFGGRSYQRGNNCEDLWILLGSGTSYIEVYSYGGSSETAQYSLTILTNTHYIYDDNGLLEYIYINGKPAIHFYYDNNGNLIRREIIVQ